MHQILGKSGYLLIQLNILKYCWGNNVFLHYLYISLILFKKEKGWCSVLLVIRVVFTKKKKREEKNYSLPSKTAITNSRFQFAITDVLNCLLFRVVPDSMQGNVLRKIHVTENPTPFYLEFAVQRSMSISESKEIKKKNTSSQLSCFYRLWYLCILGKVAKYIQENSYRGMSFQA